MSYDPWRTRLRVSGIVLPVWSYIGITEGWTEVDQVEKRRDVNGGTCVLRPLWAKKYKISLSASGPAIRWVPAFEKLDKETVVALESTRFMTDGILAGQSSTTLMRPPVAGSVKVWRAGDRFEAPVPFTLLDRLVSVAAPASEDLVVRFRPVFYVTRNSASGNHPETQGTVDWQAEFEEA
jgi:hypothetical protein